MNDAYRGNRMRNGELTPWPRLYQRAVERGGNELRQRIISLMGEVAFADGTLFDRLLPWPRCDQVPPSSAERDRVRAELAPRHPDLVELICDLAS